MLHLVPSFPANVKENVQLNHKLYHTALIAYQKEKMIRVNN